MEKIAHVLFGGVAGGKSTLAKHLEASGLPVLAADDFIYNEDYEMRNGRVYFAQRAYRAAIVEVDRSFVLDTMVNRRNVTLLHDSGFVIHAIHLLVPGHIRKARIELRKALRVQCRERIDSALKTHEMSYGELRSLLRSPDAYTRSPLSNHELDEIIRPIYSIGAVHFDERVPDPRNFELWTEDYVTQIKHNEPLPFSMKTLFAKRRPF